MMNVRLLDLLKTAVIKSDPFVLFHWSVLFQIRIVQSDLFPDGIQDVHDIRCRLERDHGTLGLPFPDLPGDGIELIQIAVYQRTGSFEYRSCEKSSVEYDFVSRR